MESKNLDKLTKKDLIAMNAELQKEVHILREQMDEFVNNLKKQKQNTDTTGEKSSDLQQADDSRTHGIHGYVHIHLAVVHHGKELFLPLFLTENMPDDI